LLGKVIGKISSIRTNNIDTVCQLVKPTINNPKIIPLITTPQTQLRDITTATRDTVLEYFNKNDTVTSTTLAYRIPSMGNKWALVSGLTPSAFLLEEIADDKNSTFYTVVHDKNRASIFRNSKAKAAIEGIYKRDRNEHYDMPGSIICRYIPVIMDNVKLIEAVLSISTMTEPFVDGSNIHKEADAEKTVNDYILTHYEAKLKFELLLFYIHERNDAIKARDGTIKPRRTYWSKLIIQNE